MSESEGRRGTSEFKDSLHKAIGGGGSGHQPLQVPRQGRAVMRRAWVSAGHGPRAAGRGWSPGPASEG
eukprot:11296923-Alexandrium_andersonii.AAC.1